MNKSKSIKVNNERKFFIKKNLVRVYKIDNNKYLKIISDNSFLYKILLKFLITISIISASTICLNLIITRANFTFQKKIINFLQESKVENYHMYIFVITMGLINIFYLLYPLSIGIFGTF